MEILGRVDISERGLKVTMSLRRNADASLPASHVIDLKFDFNGVGIGTVPGLLMKTGEQARGAPLEARSVRVTDGFYMLGLSNAPQSRAGNVAMLTQREWFDLPFVYKTQRRGILAIEKGLYEPAQRGDCGCGCGGTGGPCVAEGPVSTSSPTTYRVNRLTMMFSPNSAILDEIKSLIV